MKMEGEKVIEKRRATAAQYEAYLERQKRLAILGLWGVPGQFTFFELADDFTARVPPSVGQSGSWSLVEEDDFSSQIHVDITIDDRPLAIEARVRGDSIEILSATTSSSPTPCPPTSPTSPSSAPFLRGSLAPSTYTHPSAPPADLSTRSILSTSNPWTFLRSRGPFGGGKRGTTRFMYSGCLETDEES